MSRNAKIYTVSGIILVIILVGAFGYGAGFRFGNHFSIGKVGILSMTLPLSETSVFIDQSQKIQTTKENEVVEIKLSPKSHNIIVSHDGYFPWTKTFSLPSAGNVTLSPLFVSQNTSGLMIGQSDPEYWKIKSGILSDVLPSKTHPRISADKSTILWVEDNAMLTQVANGSPHTVLQPDTVIKNVDFYKDRSDAVIFSTFNAVYVIEVDTEGTQNFMPIYKGADPSFIKSDNNSIYIEDENSLMQVSI